MKTSRILTSLLVSALSWGLTAPASGLDDPTGVISSENVELLGTIPNPGVIGARFRGDVMYVTSLTGLTTYDISEPAAPQLLGALPLPHFENEDVDLGGNILLISNDAAESTGILYVIDISNPAAPSLLSTFQMGGNPLLGGPGHTASCVLACSFAWVTDGGGIRVIDLRNPAAPVTVGTFATPAGGGLITHDVQVDGDGIAWVVGFGGTAGYRLPAGYDGNGLGEMVAKTNSAGNSRYLDTLGLDDGSTYNDFVHHNSHRRAGDDVVFVTEEDYTRPGCRGAGSFETWSLPVDDLGNPTGADMTPLDKWETELLADTAQPAAVCSAHYFDIRSNVVAQGWYEQGMRLLDVSDPADIRQIGYYITPASAMWASYWAPTDAKGRILYALDASHGIDVLEFDRPTTGALAEPSRCTEEQGKSTPGSGKGKGKKNGHGKTRTVCPGEERPEPVEAPILPGWVGSTGVAAGAPSPTLGYACRIRL
ncbi:MAG TPA: hypothetical protein VEA19_03680 [Actinomycetota bacterium]|nr:hypothetical protein [Actinomycetota bacterium]